MDQRLDSSQAVAQSALFNLAGILASALYALLLIPLIVGYVGVEQFGLWSLVLALSGYLGLVDLGMGSSFVKYVAEFAHLGKFDDVNRVVQHGLGFYLIIGAAMLAAGYLLFPFLFRVLQVSPVHYGLAFTVFMLALVGFGISSVLNVVGSVLSGIQRADALNMVILGMFAAKFFGIWFALHRGYGLVGLMVADLAVGFATVAPMIWVARKHFPYLSFHVLSYDASLMRRLLRFGGQLQVSKLAEVVQSQFDKLLLTRFIGLGAVSLYDFGSRPLVRLRTLPLTAIASIVPAISALDVMENTARIQAALTRATKYVIILALPVFAFLISFAHEFLRLWLGESYDQSAVTLQILSVAYLASVVAAPLALVSQGKGEPKHQMRATLLQVFVNVLLSTLLVMQFGYFGAVAGTTVAMITGAAVFLGTYGRRFWNRTGAAVFSLAFKPIISVLPSILVCVVTHRLAVAELAIHTRPGQAIALAVVGVMFLVAYALMIRWTNTLSEDDRSFVVNLHPQRWKHLVRYF
jgi:O-antigen/teichoic acid export membrane protein